MHFWRELRPEALARAALPENAQTPLLAPVGALGLLYRVVKQLTIAAAGLQLRPQRFPRARAIQGPEYIEADNIV